VPTVDVGVLGLDRQADFVAYVRVDAAAGRDDLCQEKEFYRLAKCLLG
jgi:hypothetical protein